MAQEAQPAGERRMALMWIPAPIWWNGKDFFLFSPDQMDSGRTGISGLRRCMSIKDATLYIFRNKRFHSMPFVLFRAVRDLKNHWLDNLKIIML